MIIDVAKPDIITIIDHHTSNTKGLLSNPLLINDIDQSRSYHQNSSPHFNHKRSIVKVSNVKIVS